MACSYLCTITAFHLLALKQHPAGGLQECNHWTEQSCLVQALANEAGCSFINVRASGLQSKWFGETQKLVQALFTLAYKIQPCIIFIGEYSSICLP